jgi:hypothetical protein
VRLISREEPKPFETIEVKNHGCQDNELGAICRRAVFFADVITSAGSGANAGSQVRAIPKRPSRRDCFVRKRDWGTDLFVPTAGVNGAPNGLKRRGKQTGGNVNLGDILEGIRRKKAVRLGRIFDKKVQIRQQDRDK